MKCHYEVLDIPKDADDTTLKNAYRKLALKWHPDKNLDNPNVAKEQFQLIQQAYDVLSDRQERAWYDNHRDQILKGANSEYEDNCLNVFPYFTTTCFKGYEDNEGGFYSVYRKVFEQIAKEDIEFVDRDEQIDIPSFGWADSDYDTVVKVFYNYWIDYSTKKSYTWLDPYDIREARGHKQLLKAIEKENKKNRLKARKERNEEIRNLVIFVRKRDRRVQAYSKLREEKILENRKKQEIISKQKRLERQQLHNNEIQADWLKFDNVESELEEIEKHLNEEFEGINDEDNDEEGEEKTNEDLYCVACTKLFKNIKSFQNHEASRKHRENIEILKETNANYEDKIDDCDETTINGSSNDLDSSTTRKKKKKKSKNVAVVNNCSSDSELFEFVKETIDFDFEDTKKKKSNKKSKTKTNNSNLQEQQEEAAAAATEDETEAIKNEETSNKRHAAKQNVEESQSDDISNKVNNNNCCAVCKSVFPSKNKLFSHLEKTGHSVYLPNNNNNSIKVKQKDSKKISKNKR